MEKEEANIENELSNIGETALIKKITKSFKLSNKSSILFVDAIERSNKSTVSPSVVKGHKNLCVRKTRTLYDPTAIVPTRAR